MKKVLLYLFSTCPLLFSLTVEIFSYRVVSKYGSFGQSPGVKDVDMDINLLLFDLLSTASFLFVIPALIIAVMLILGKNRKKNTWIIVYFILSYLVFGWYFRQRGILGWYND
jgi:hypothetical protein